MFDFKLVQYGTREFYSKYEMLLLIIDAEILNLRILSQIDQLEDKPSLIFMLNEGCMDLILIRTIFTTSITGIPKAFDRMFR